MLIRFPDLDLLGIVFDDLWRWTAQDISTHLASTYLAPVEHCFDRESSRYQIHGHNDCVCISKGAEGREIVWVASVHVASSLMVRLAT